MTSEPRQALCTQLCDTHERGSRDTDKTPQWPALQSRILAATHRAGGGRGDAFAQALHTRVADNHPHTRARESGPEPASNSVLVIPSCFPDATWRRCPRQKGESQCFQGHTPKDGHGTRTETGIWAKAISSLSRVSTSEHRPIRSALLLSNYQGLSSSEHLGNPVSRKYLSPFLGLMSQEELGFGYHMDLKELLAWLNCWLEESRQVTQRL